MKCKNCGSEQPDSAKTCHYCGKFLEGYTINNVTGEKGYRGGDGDWYKSQDEYYKKLMIEADCKRFLLQMKEKYMVDAAPIIHVIQEYCRNV